MSEAGPDSSESDSELMLGTGAGSIVGNGTLTGTSLVLMRFFWKPKHLGHKSGPLGKIVTLLWLNWP